MDISDWPMERIMQLPIDCFGERWPVTFTDQVGAGNAKYRLSPFNLPDRCILWSVVASAWMRPGLGETGRVWYVPKLTDKRYETDVEVARLDDLIPGLFEKSGVLKILWGFNNLGPMKLFINSQGRKLLLRFNNAEAATIGFTISFVFSSIPKEIPDFYMGSPIDQWDELIRLMRIGVKIR